MPFTGGNTTWDKDQNQLLADMGYEVHQVAFPKEINKFVFWVADFDFSKIRWKPIYVIGRSSGGYLAKVFYDTYKSKITSALYICPVLDPELRKQLKPKFASKTEEFFGRCIPSKLNNLDNNKEFLMLAKNDENVPDECFTENNLSVAQYLGPSTHSGMLKCTSRKFTDAICKLFV